MTATLGRRRDGAFLVGSKAYSTVGEAAAETFTRYVLEDRTLPSSAANWVRAKLIQTVPSYWREVVDELRYRPVEWSRNAGAYHCGRCGHWWYEIAGTE